MSSSQPSNRRATIRQTLQDNRADFCRASTVLYLADDAELESAMTALDGHVAYAWWRVWGDTFHTNDYELSNVTIPDSWFEDADNNALARRLGRELIDAITPENIVANRSGTGGNTFENVNFYQAAPETIRQLDKLHLTSLGLPLEPLLTQLHTIRSGSNWRL